MNIKDGVTTIINKITEVTFGTYTARMLNCVI